MKTSRFVFILLFVCLAVLLAGCGTGVTVSTWAPAEVDLGTYKTVAIQSVVPYRNYYYDSMYVDLRFDMFEYPVPYDLRYLNSPGSGWTSAKAAEAATSTLEKAVDQGIYTVINSRKTDTLISMARSMGTTVRQTLMNNGIDVLITAAIDSMNYDEYVTCKRTMGMNNKYIYRYYLNQRASLSMTYYVQDVRNATLIYAGSLSGAYPSSYSLYEETLIGTTDENGNFRPEFYYILEPEQLFKKITDGFFTELRNKLTPHRVSTSIELMSNKNKVKSIEEGYKLADKEEWGSALAVFEAEWRRSGDMPSGYNAAVMYFATGKTDQALELAWQVWERSGSGDAYSLYTKIKNVKDAQQEAARQINEKVSRPSSSGELIGF